jgi:carboxypeptidase Taq
MAILHETGHALYSAGLPQAWRHQPVGEARGMAVHESQSLLIEMQVCRSPAFLGYLAPLVATTFGRDDPALSEGNLYRRAIHVARGHIRVDADEVTYPLHVILRYRLEKAMLGGDLEVADLPGAWNEGMRALLGLTPPDDRLGCLQDIHWSVGAIGYFPCYTLGAIMAAQLFEAARTAEPEILPAVGRGDFRPLLGWLRANVHAQGSLLDMPELLTHATGRPLELQPFLDHLRARYAA